jgi:hypothetical protein
VRGYLPGATMQIVYDSQNYHVIEYSGIDGFEVTNKSAHACAYFHGPVAVAFRDNFARFIAENPSVDSVDEFLGGFDSLMNLPTVLH